MAQGLGSRAAKLFGEGEESRLNTGSFEDFKQLSTIPRLFDILPYESYEPTDGLFFNRNTTGFVLQGEPVVGASLSDQAQLSDFFRQAENLPEGSSLQFLLFASPKIEPKLNYWQHYRKDQFPELAARRAQFLKDKAFQPNDDNFIRDYKLLISFTYPERLTGLMERHQIVQIREVLQGYLNQINLHTQVLDAAGLIREVGAILNFNESTSSTACNYDSLNSLNRQVLDKAQGWKVEKDQVLIEGTDYAFKSFVPKNKPNYWALGHMDKFLGDVFKPNTKISCPYLLHYGLFVMPGQGQEKHKVTSKRETLENMLKNKMRKWVGGIEEHFAEFSEAAEELKGGERIVQAGLSCTLFCKKEKLQEVERQVASAWRHAGWMLSPATYDHLTVLIGSMPMMWTMGKESKWFGLRERVYGAAKVLETLGRAEKTITKEAQNMLPIVGEWKGQVAPGVPLVGRRGQLFFWNPFDDMFLKDSKLSGGDKNYNLCISGASGSGKSFFCNELIVNTLSVGGKAFVLDKGYSFKNMCSLLGGHHIDFSFTSDLSLNPFTHIPTGGDNDSVELRGELLNIVVQIIKTMAMPTREPSEVQSSFLDEAVLAIWHEKKTDSTVNDIYEWLQNHKDSRAQDLARMLMKFSKKGRYSHLFNRPATVNLDHDFVVIETQNLMNHEELRAVLVQMMIVQVGQKMLRSDRNCPCLTLIDEAWELIQGKASGNFIEKYVRTARKFRSCLALATQNLSDYFKEDSPGATVAFANSTWKCVFRQESLDFVEKVVQTEQDVEYAKRVVGSFTRASTFSEFGIFGNEIKGVIGRLYCDPFAQLLYSTNPQDYADLQKYLKQGMAINDAIYAVLQERAGKVAGNTQDLRRAA